MTNKNNSFEVRMLTLKRWNPPQTTALFSNNNTEQTFGQYVSFQNHHFIDISPPSSSIDLAYNELTQLRKQQRCGLYDVVHTVQSMTIMGKKNLFWETPANVLHITFIQLTNSAQWTLEKLETEIEKVITEICPSEKDSVRDPRWVLYYTLDFCDFILFTKDIPFEKYNDILWKLSLLRTSKFNIIRDTFTISSFSYAFLSNAIKQLDSGNDIGWNDSTALSININFQSISSWTNLHQILTSQKIPCTFHRISGRDDINIVTDTLSSSQILSVIRTIDAMCIPDADTTLGGYEIKFVTDAWNKPIHSNRDARQERGFEPIANQLMMKLYEQCEKIGVASLDYVFETKRAIVSLLKNGFSEEFVLSVYLSFITFLKISLEGHHAIQTPGTPKDISAVMQMLDTMKRRYFNALNALVLCTMHGERQFIQAPAFNATYFDVPPKLLVFYSFISYSIAYNLKDSEEVPYRFVICPDYRHDIFVDPLDTSHKKQISEHLAVIYLCEKDFYSPVRAIYLLSHEIAHYLGVRFREKRAKLIFHTIAHLLLCQTNLFRLPQSVSSIKSRKSVLSLLTSSLGDYMLKEFEAYQTAHEEPLDHYLTDIIRFLNMWHYGYAFFDNPTTYEKIITGWINVLDTELPCVSVAKKEYVTRLRTIADGLTATPFFPYDSKESYEFFARDCVHQIRMSDYRIHSISPQSNPYGFIALCEDCIQAFSEAYSDLRMIEISGKELDLQTYEDLLKTTKPESKLQMQIRHDAVCLTLFPKKKWTRWVPYSRNWPAKYTASDIMLFTATENVAAYLTCCRQKNGSLDTVQNALKIFKSDDIRAQIYYIRDSITQYRNTLLHYTQEFLNSMYESDAP